VSIGVPVGTAAAFALQVPSTNSLCHIPQLSASFFFFSKYEPFMKSQKAPDKEYVGTYSEA
jgi:hypothetical protein